MLPFLLSATMKKRVQFPTSMRKRYLGWNLLKIVILFVSLLIIFRLLSNKTNSFDAMQMEELPELFWVYRYSGEDDLYPHDMDNWMGGTCNIIWEEWRRLASKPSPEVPPPVIPKGMWKEYTSYGRIPVYSKYYNQAAVPRKIIWEIDEFSNKTKEELIHRSTYGNETGALYNALTYYKRYIDGMSGLVIGSLRPWCELFALRHGARELTTLEFQELDIRTEQHTMNYLHPIDIAEDWPRFDESFDFAISYSSIEHSGLGRFGDPLDPFGDLRETAKVRCLLKPGGIFFLAVPTGHDSLQWNAHRVYGTLRMPWLIRGFDLIGVFHMNDQRTPSPGIPTSILSNPSDVEYVQPVLILEKK